MTRPARSRYALVGVIVSVAAACASGSTQERAALDDGGPQRLSAPSAGEDPDKPGPPVVVLDPGHNGGNASHAAQISRPVPAGFGESKPCNTVGTQSAHGYPEHAFTYDLARRTQAILTGEGIGVRLTRESDSGVGPCVDRRAGVGNSEQAVAVVSIHADGAPRGRGFHVIEAARPPAGPDMAARSHRLALAVHSGFRSGSGFTPSTYAGDSGFDHRDDLAGLNLSTRPTIFIECGNMRDPADAALMESAAGRQRAAEALAAGILEFLGRG